MSTDNGNLFCYCRKTMNQDPKTYLWRRITECNGGIEPKLGSRFATDAGIGHGSLQRIREGKTDARLDTVVKLADHLGVTVHDLLDPSPQRVANEGFIQVPLLSAAASMGHGFDQPEGDQVIGSLTLSPNWLGKTIQTSNTQALRFIHAYGDSMAPTFSDGDILLVDTSRKDPSVDGVYVLVANRRLYIKRVRQRIDGQYEISSDNPTVKTVDVLNGDHAVELLGRVVYVWNGVKI